MDTDDVAVRNRFELQLSEFEINPQLDICGSSIFEFEDNIEHIVSKRAVPLDDALIKQYQKRRDAFNHMTVMYKKETVLKAGNYRSCLLMEDTLLWVHMMLVGAKCKNLKEPLVYALVGWNYFKKYVHGRKKVLETGYITIWDYFVTCAVQFVVAMLPEQCRALIFKKMLRK